MGDLREKTAPHFGRKIPVFSGRMRGEGAEKGFFAHRVWQNAAECLYLRPNSIVYAAVSTLFIFPILRRCALRCPASACGFGRSGRRTVGTDDDGHTGRGEHHPARLTVEVYNITGVKVFVHRVDGDDRTFTLTAERGIYIVKVGKVVRRVTLL